MVTFVVKFEFLLDFSGLVEAAGIGKHCGVGMMQNISDCKPSSVTILRKLQAMFYR